VPASNELQARLHVASRRLVRVEELACELNKAVELGIDVSEVARLGKDLDDATSEWVVASSFLPPGEVSGAFATCNGVAFSLAGHAKAAVGFSAMANRATWKARWDQVWSEWLRALLWRDHVLEGEALALPHRAEGDQAEPLEPRR
jgi:hypothetical protein